MPKRFVSLYLIALSGYAGLSILMTWPLAAHLSDSLGSGIDPQLQTWILAWDVHALRSHPAEVWQAPIFFPYPNTLAYSDHHLVLALLSAPIMWLTNNPVLAYNLLVLLSFVLSGWAVYALGLDMLQECSGGRAEEALMAFVAGAAFSFGSFRMAQFVHLQMLQTCWLAFALLFLRRSLRPQGRWWDVLLLALFSALQCITALYFAYFTLLTLGLYILVWMIEVGRRSVGSGDVEAWERHKTQDKRHQWGVGE